MLLEFSVCSTTSLVFRHEAGFPSHTLPQTGEPFRLNPEAQVPRMLLSAELGFNISPKKFTFAVNFYYYVMSS